MDLSALRDPLRSVKPTRYLKIAPPRVEPTLWGPQKALQTRQGAAL